MSGKVRFEFGAGDCAETESYSQLNLLAHGQLVERSLQSRCGGHCECGTCRVEVRSGAVSPMREAERQLLERLGVPLDGRVRLACQTFPEELSTVIVAVPTDKFIDARGKKRR